MRTRSLVVCFALIAGGFACGYISNTGARAASKEQNPHALVEHFADVLVLVENNYVDTVERDRLLKGAIKGMLAELDPHSEYFTRDELRDFNEESQGRFGGVGIEVEVIDGKIIVIAPIEGGPAEKAGIQSGDQIIEIDGQKSLSMESGVKRLRGAPGAPVHVVIKRATDGDKTVVFDLIRAEISVPSVTSQMLPGHVMYLRVKQFQTSTSNDFLGAIKKAKQEDPAYAGVVMDLRRNPGGLVNQAVFVADEFLETGLIYSLKGRGRLLEEANATPGGSLTTVPCAVLVDQSSASASELLAGALQDHHRCTIVGATTFGKGSVQEIINIPDGAALKLTIARYFTPSGRSIQALGITPDISVSALPAPSSSADKFMRESDLPHALPAESVGDAGTDAPAAIDATTEAGVQSDAAASVLPPKGVDLAHDTQLSLAHQFVLSLMKK